MTNEEIIEKMIVKVEEIVREKAREDFNDTRMADRKTVSKNIINELDRVIKDED